MSRNRIILIMIVIIATGAVGLLVYGYATGRLRPSADVTGQITTQNFTTTEQLNQGVFEDTEIKDGYIQLKAVQ